MNITNIPTPTLRVHLEQFLSNLVPTSFGLSGFTSPNLQLLIHDYLKLAISVVIPLKLLYFAVYARTKNYHKTFHCLIFLSLASIWVCPYAAPLKCGIARMVRNCAISSMTMKLLDIWVRRNALPVYKKDKVDKVPSDWIISLLLVTEMRYESFTPNHIKLPESRKTYTEPWDFAIHIGIFSVLQALPIQHPTLLALKVLLSIYISGTAMHLLFRYKSSPALFGPIYLANSLAGFWSETWHNVYASACVSLTYLPIRNSLRHFGVSKLLSHAIGIIGVFSLMAIFHVYVMYPVLDTTTLIRVGLFFFLNGIATIAEAMIWGREKHWMKSLLAWAFEITLATWTANSMAMPIIPLNCSSGATIY